MRSKLEETLDATVIRGETRASLAAIEGVTPQAIKKRLQRARRSGRYIPPMNAKLQSPRTFTLQNYD
jgi:hypothetical protein